MLELYGPIIVGFYIRDVSFAAIGMVTFLASRPGIAPSIGGATPFHSPSRRRNGGVPDVPNAKPGFLHTVKPWGFHSGDGFSTLHDEDQQAYLAHCSALAAKAAVIADKLPKALSSAA